MNYKKMKQLTALILCGVLLCACSSEEIISDTNTTNNQVATTVLTSEYITYDDDDLYQAYDEETVETIDLSKESGTVEITSAGTYVLEGTLIGSVSVKVSKEDTVRLILNNVEITSSDGSAIYCTQAKKLILSMPEGTTNTIKDAATYSDQGTDAPTAAIYAQDDMTINGTGTLNVTGQYNDAITSKDTLKLIEGTYVVTSADDGFVGRDFLYVHSGTYQVNVTGDGLKTTYDTDTEKGDMIIEGGSFTITAGSDGLQAEHTLAIYDGTYTIETGGGSINGSSAANANTPGGFGMWNSASTSEETASAKGIKAGGDLHLQGGTYQLDTSDDAIHSNANITIINGNFSIASGDDGIHADSTLTMAGGTIDVTKSYEGLEGSSVVINAGYIQVTSSDDGINSAGGSDNDNTGQPSPDHFMSGGNNNIEIHGGTVQVDASGDGLDANGSITMNGGVVIVFGPEDSGNGALDYDGSFDISGGTLIACGASGMAQATSTSSTQNAIMANIATQSANTPFYITDEADNFIIGVSPTKSYSSVLISSSKLQTGATYSLYTGGSGGSVNDAGYIESGLSGGTQIDTVSISSSVTTYGSGAMGGGKGGRDKGGMPGEMGDQPQR